MSGQLAFWILAALSVAGAATVVFGRDVTRMVLGLGAFLLSVAGWFLFFGQTFLAVAQVFVYVGGVLVLVLFAIMLVHRAEGADPALTSRHDVDIAAVALSVFGIMVVSLRSAWPSMTEGPVPTSTTQVSAQFLGAYLPHLEAAGLLLLAALVAAIVIMGGEGE
ncbi:MAG: NADH-quinone oxidoreductase subunit J [Actinobacteria bacterium]|nr:NADH-quinone oxidoreductase subunit J [Actinomycetota bacterium]MCG2807508.1 NADH-quinone oxidoreductase subunit J [Coriobacteriia bacterium]